MTPRPQNRGAFSNRSLYPIFCASVVFIRVIYNWEMLLDREQSRRLCARPEFPAGTSLVRSSQLEKIAVYLRIIFQAWSGLPIAPVMLKCIARETHLCNSSFEPQLKPTSSRRPGRRRLFCWCPSCGRDRYLPLASLLWLSPFLNQVPPPPFFVDAAVSRPCDFVLVCWGPPPTICRHGQAHVHPQPAEVPPHARLPPPRSRKPAAPGASTVSHVLQPPPMGARGSQGQLPSQASAADGAAAIPLEGGNLPGDG